MIQNCGRNSLGTSGRSFSSCAVGSVAFPGAGSSKRTAMFNAANPPTQKAATSTKVTISGFYGNYNGNFSGTYGGGGGGGSPNYYSGYNVNGNKPLPGGNGGSGICCIFASLTALNNQDLVSGNAPSTPPVYATQNGQSPFLQLSGTQSGNVNTTNSCFTNNSGTGGYTGLTINDTNYYSIFLGPGTFTVETNISQVEFLLCAGGGGGSGGGFLDYSLLSGGGGGGGGASVGGTLLLYNVKDNETGGNNNLTVTTTFDITVGSGGGGGTAGPYCYDATANNGTNQGRNACSNYVVGSKIAVNQGGNGGGGGMSQMVINQTSAGLYAQILPITITCDGGGGGYAGNLNPNALTRNPDPYNPPPIWGTAGTGGSGGTYSLEGFSNAGTQNLSLLVGGLGGGNGSYVNSTLVTPAQPGAGFSSSTSNGINNNNNTFTAPAKISGDFVTINTGGGGGGSNSYFSYENGPSVKLINQGGSGSGGNGGSAPIVVTSTLNTNIFLYIWDVIDAGTTSVDAIQNIYTVCKLFEF